MKLACGRGETCLSCEYYLEGATDTARLAACTIVGELIGIPDLVLQNERLVVDRVSKAIARERDTGQIRGIEILPAVVESLIEAGKQPISKES